MINGAETAVAELRPTRPRRALLLAAAAGLWVAGPSHAQSISAGMSSIDEARHVERIASNKKFHFACAVSVATRQALGSKATPQKIADEARQECRKFEIEHKGLLSSGVPTTNGAVAAASPQVIRRLLAIRRNEVRASVLAAVKEVR